jgi:hypothetical protein
MWDRHRIDKSENFCIIMGVLTEVQKLHMCQILYETKVKL